MDMISIAALAMIWCFLLTQVANEILLLGRDARTIDEYQKGSNQTVNYFVAGMFNQPREAFAFMLDLPIFENDTIKLLPYGYGWADFREKAAALIEDAHRNDYRKVRIFTISVGATVARYASAQAGVLELECYDINPCWGSQCLEPQMCEKLRYERPLILLLMMVLGPLMFARLIRRGDNRFSVALAFSQVDQLLSNTKELPDHRQYIRGVILSSDDEFLCNPAIHAFYARCHPKYLQGVRHASTIGAAEQYRTAMKQLLVSPRSE